MRSRRLEKIHLHYQNIVYNKRSDLSCLLLHTDLITCAHGDARSLTVARSRSALHGQAASTDGREYFLSVTEKSQEAPWSVCFARNGLGPA
jgi:hypothetical protein